MKWFWVCYWAVLAMWNAAAAASDLTGQDRRWFALVVGILCAAMVPLCLWMVRSRLKEIKAAQVSELEIDVTGMAPERVESFSLWMQEYRLYICRHCEKILESRVHLIIHNMADHNVDPNDTYREIRQQDAIRIQ